MHTNGEDEEGRRGYMNTTHTLWIQLQTRGVDPDSEKPEGVLRCVCISDTHNSAQDIVRAKERERECVCVCVREGMFVHVLRLCV